MFSDITKFSIFLKLNVYNIYFTTFMFFFFIIIFLIGNKFSLWVASNRIIMFKNAILCVFTLSFILFLFYFFIIVHFKNMILIQNYVYCNYTFNYLNKFVLDTSDIIIIYLCYLIGFVSIITLGDRFWGANYHLSLLFLYFTIIINLLCQSVSLFELFIFYELLLLPSILFVYKSGYTKKSHQANIYFFIWTQLGSLFVLFGILYISAACGTTDFLFIKNFHFTKTESYYLYLLFFFGFGVKVPV